MQPGRPLEKGGRSIYRQRSNRRVVPPYTALPGSKSVFDLFRSPSGLGSIMPRSALEHCGTGHFQFPWKFFERLS